ncbi:signal peptidase I [Geofilum rubicundum]|uniref:Signal peptidase I n=1 Tax=Geofilum rubicundum JCM 15548 TaxID=1236989 RepID=A0A0E9LUY5_9BACT|nr:signal peptidase I [Geofilum rubicundum]GAO28926.1 signal peptidase I [Geofilum rubicundum JCM 15548]
MKRNLIKLALWLLLGVLISDLVYRYGFELLKVPTSSMENTIEPGQYVLVNKLIPGPRFYANDPDKYNRPYRYKDLKYGDIIVFNFPDADTIIANKPGESYYLLRRQHPNLDSLLITEGWGDLQSTEVTQRPRMVKRITALPGDTVQIERGTLMINGQGKSEEHACLTYLWTGQDQDLPRALARLNNEVEPLIEGNKTYLRLNNQDLERLGDLSTHLKREILSPGIPDAYIFPFMRSWLWNADNLGPIYLPRQGETIELTPQNLPIYRRMIEVFEQTPLEVKGNYIFANQIPISKYTFKLSYYWVHGDNRPRSFDSRYWGPVPENHIVGVVKYRK